MKTRLNDNKAPNLYYVRTEKGVEVDLILKKEGMLFPFEIRSSMTPNNDFAKNMRRFCSSEINSGEMAVVYCGDYYESFQNCRYINYITVADVIRE